MTLASRNSPLLDNGSLTLLLWRCGFMETDLVRKALSISTESTNSFHGYAQATNVFHVYALDYKSGSAGKIDSVGVQFSSREFISRQSEENSEVECPTVEC
jgi:hypothetical protein